MRQVLFRSLVLAAAMAAVSAGAAALAENVDPSSVDAQYAWGENVGWINFQHGQTAYRITSDDGDGVAGASDNCPFDGNPAQTNTDAGNSALNLPGTDSLGDVCDNDEDGDGCSDAEELASGAGSENFGGQRNPLSVWDYYDVNGDARIDLNDTLDILAHFGHGTADDPLDNLMDRMVPGGAQPWQTVEDTSGNGIDLTDALDNLASFGHDCSGPP